MLSSDLQSLSNWFDGLYTGKTVVTKEGLDSFKAELRSSIDKARALEQTCVAQAVRLTRDQFAANVVPFPRAAGGSDNVG